MKSRIAFALATLLLACLSGAAAAQKYSDCAYRDGADGPCTCAVGGTAGMKRLVVSRQRCVINAKRDGTGKPASILSGSAASQEPGDVPGDRGLVNAPTSPVQTSSLPATLERVRARGRLICGINGSLAGFSVRSASGEWQGFDVELCRAVAAAVLGGADKVDLIPLDTTDRFAALKSGRIDVLMRNTTWTLAREVEHGVEFAGVAFYDGQGFLAKQELGLVSAQQLSGARLCVQTATTTEANVGFYFGKLGISPRLQSFKDRGEMVAAYRDGRCDAYTADRSSLLAERLSLAQPDAHSILPEVISREPLGPVVRSGDIQWLRIVRWTLAGLINGEEESISRRSFVTRAALPPGATRLLEGAEKAAPLAGLPPDWLRQALQRVGSYSDIFDETLGKGSPLGMERGLNALWQQGGLLYAPPMW